MRNFLLIIFVSIILLSSLTVLTGCKMKTEGKIMTNKKVLVAYFSATGTTKRLAEKIAGVTGGDLFEIKPEKPYTAADLDWTNSNSRTSLEMKDKNCRPEIAFKIEDIEKYEVVFVGFPVWWYREPSIIDTFMESYDFSGKLVIPFATSGGSPIGNSGENMQKLAPDAKVLEGKCFPVNVSEDELQNRIKEWLE